MFPKDTLTHGQEELGIHSPIFKLVDSPLYHLTLPQWFVLSLSHIGLVTGR